MQEYFIAQPTQLTALHIMDLFANLDVLQENKKSERARGFLVECIHILEKGIQRVAILYLIILINLSIPSSFIFLYLCAHNACVDLLIHNRMFYLIRQPGSYTLCCILVINNSNHSSGKRYNNLTFSTTYFQSKVKLD